MSDIQKTQQLNFTNDGVRIGIQAGKSIVHGDFIVQ